MSPSPREGRAGGGSGGGSRASPGEVGLVPRMACGDLCHALCRTTLSKMAKKRTVRQSVRQRLATKWAEQRVLGQALGSLLSPPAWPKPLRRGEGPALSSRRGGEGEETTVQGLTHTIAAAPGPRSVWKSDKL